jgi:S1-C subfamily serine protease|tara:strand:- start:1351 stop:2223 length:873 start_codon:yes stop_codon:yes gene_type:complete
MFKGTPFAIFIAAAIFLSPLAVKAQDKTDAPVQRITQMLYPSVMVDVGKGQGSGTIIYSEWRDDDEAWTMVLTNHHVVKSAIQILSEFDPKKGEEVKREHRRPVKIRFWSYNQFSSAIGTSGRTAHIVAWDRHRDLALLRVEDKEQIYENVAIMWPEDADGPYVFQKSWAVGSGLGNPPYPTEGLLSNTTAKDKEGYSLYQASAPIIFGNSGGSLYVYSETRGNYELIGVPSMVSAVGFGSIVSFVAWSRPVEEIRSFLRQADFGWVIGDAPEEEAEEEAEKETADDSAE